MLSTKKSYRPRQATSDIGVNQFYLVTLGNYPRTKVITLEVRAMPLLLVSDPWADFFILKVFSQAFNHSLKK